MLLNFVGELQLYSTRLVADAAAFATMSTTVLPNVPRLLRLQTPPPAAAGEDSEIRITIIPMQNGGRNLEAF